MTTFKFNQSDYDNGIALFITIDFIEVNHGLMKVLNFTVTDGVHSTDFSGVLEYTTLLEIVKEFMRGE